MPWRPTRSSEAARSYRSNPLLSLEQRPLLTGTPELFVRFALGPEAVSRLLAFVAELASTANCSDQLTGLRDDDLSHSYGRKKRRGDVVGHVIPCFRRCGGAGCVRTVANLDLVGF